MATATTPAARPAPRKTPKIGVILPDSKSSARWETADRKYLKEAFEAAGVEYDIQNAQNDKTAFQTIADQMITSGVTVLMIVNLDSGTGKAVLDKAKSQGVATIDYDRLTLGGSARSTTSASTTRTVGKLQGEGLVKCLTDEGREEPGRRRAQRLADRQQRHAVQERLRLGAQAEVRRQGVHQGPRPVRSGLGQRAGRHDLRADADQANGKIDGVLAANDGLGNAAISVLKKNKLNGKVPVTGQDATVRACRTSSPATSA